jgi:hypothetical protein
MQMEINENRHERSWTVMADAAVEDIRDQPAGRLADATVSSEERETGSEDWFVFGRIACFLGMLAVVAIGLNALITLGLSRVKTGQFGVSNRIMSGDVNAQIVIAGSSRALSDFDSRTIGLATNLSTFNIGRNGSQTDMQLAVLRAYLEHNRKPEIVIQTLDSFSFQATHEVYDPVQYVPYLHDEALYGALHQVNPEIWKSRYIPLYGYVVDDMNMSWLLGLEALFGRSPREDYFLGFNPRSKKWSDDFASFKAANAGGVKWPIDPEGQQSLEDMVRLCRERGIQLIFVFAPEYSEMQSLTKNRQEVFTGFRELSAKYNVPFWDYSDWKYASDTDFFQNSQHLNEDGAEVFSTDLGSRLSEYAKANPLFISALQKTR